MYSPDDCLMISGLQHFRFCRRQWALIHIEQQWAENLRTVEGNLLHERAHNEQLRESRGYLLIVRGLRVQSLTLGLTGQCDVVEFRRDDTRGVTLCGKEGAWLPYPVEYKHGAAKQDGRDALQLCAQAMCLEEMLVCEIPSGALFTAKRAATCRSASHRSCARRCGRTRRRCTICIAGATPRT